MPPDEITALINLKCQLLVYKPQEYAPKFTFINLDDPDVASWMEDYRLVKGKKAILDEVTKLIEQNPRIVSNQGFRMAPETESQKKAFKARHSGQFDAGIIVPFDDALERWAQRLVKEDSLRSMEGMYILENYKSDANIELIKKLLTSNFFYRGNNYTEEPGYQDRIFKNRETAYRLLTTWGVRVAEPIMQDTVDLKDSITTIDLWLPITDQRLSRIETCKKVSQLVLQAGELTDSQLTRLGALTTLRRLTFIQANKITNEGMRAFASKSRIETLWFTSVQIDDEGLKALSEIKTLKELRIDCRKITATGVLAFRQLRPDVKITTKF